MYCFVSERNECENDFFDDMWVTFYIIPGVKPLRCVHIRPICWNKSPAGPPPLRPAVTSQKYPTTLGAMYFLDILNL